MNWDCSIQFLHYYTLPCLSKWKYARTKHQIYRDIHLWQRPHNTFKCNQSHRIRRKCSQKARQEPSPISSPPILHIYYPSSRSPIWKSPNPIIQSTGQRICHDPLLYHIRWITRYPEDLCTQSSSPKIYHRCT